MKNIIFALCLAIAGTTAFAGEAPETKKVCVDVKKDGKPVVDQKTGKTKQSCKEVKQHKKLDGATKVPGK